MNNLRNFKNVEEFLRLIAGMQELSNGMECDRLDKILEDPQDELAESDLEWVRAARGETGVPEYLKKKNENIR